MQGQRDVIHVLLEFHADVLKVYNKVSVVCCLLMLCGCVCLLVLFVEFCWLQVVQIMFLIDNGEPCHKTVGVVLGGAYMIMFPHMKMSFLICFGLEHRVRVVSSVVVVVYRQ